MAGASGYAQPKQRGEVLAGLSAYAYLKRRSNSAFVIRPSKPVFTRDK